MNYFKVLPIVIVILILQLCDTSALKSKLNHKKFNYPKQADNYANDSEEERYVCYHHTRQPRSVNSDNSTVLEKKEYNASITTTMTKTDIKIVDQKYSQNTSGEYKHE